MNILDDNYLDGILTRMTVEHKQNIMRTARRLNLPDDDVLFLYLGAVEYTVQLCEGVLGGIVTERQRLEQSSQGIDAAHQAQTEALIKGLRQVGLAVVADLKKSGSATTSAISQANSEVLNQSQATVREAKVLKAEMTSLFSGVAQAQETNINVLQVLSEQYGQSVGGFDNAIVQLKQVQAEIEILQHRTQWLKFNEWFSPLAALMIALLIGAGGSWWAMSLKYNDSVNVLGRNLVEWNIERIVKCQEDNNPKCTVWIVSPEQRK